jgi:WD40 repeat protein
VALTVNFQNNSRTHDANALMKALGEGVLPSPVRAVSWSPTVDLCVFVAAKHVSAHRLDGQRVWTANSAGLHSPDLEFTHIAWRDDGSDKLKKLIIGKLLATGLDDGSVYVWDVQNGRQIRQVTLAALPQGPISCLSWIGEDIETVQGDSATVSW